jgi:hypothetical protein
MFAFPIGVAGIILLIGAGWIGLILLSAALLSAAIHFVPRGVRAVRRLIEQLRELLRGLATEGLVLPPAVGLLAPDSRY